MSMIKESIKKKKMIYKCSRDHVRTTEAYKNATNIQQILCLNRNNMVHINHSVNVCLHKGFDNWSAISGSTNLNKDIVKELYERVNI